MILHNNPYTFIPKSKLTETMTEKAVIMLLKLMITCWKHNSPIVTAFPGIRKYILPKIR